MWAAIADYKCFFFFKQKILDFLRETVLDDDGKWSDTSVEGSCGLLPGQVECLCDERVAVAEADRSTDRFLDDLHSLPKKFLPCFLTIIKKKINKWQEHIVMRQN